MQSQAEGNLSKKSNTEKRLPIKYAAFYIILRISIYKYINAKEA
jgi:hypothetical protein